MVKVTIADMMVERSKLYILLPLYLILSLVPQRAYAEEKEEGESFSFDGYYRARGVYIQNLFVEPADNTSFLYQRFRLEPSFNYSNLLKVKAQIDCMDNVIWGDNYGQSKIGLFADNPSNTSLTGEEVPSIRLKRAWAELFLPVGVLKVGRQPSHFGMGLLSNSGDGFDDDFGDNLYGSTYDRILFATKPLSIVRTVLRRPEESNLILALGFDKLVDYPAGELEEGESLQTGLSSLSSSTDDVDEYILVLFYNGEQLKWGEEEGTLKGGTYQVYRTQYETFSKILISDFYYLFDFFNFFTEGEVVYIGGVTDSLPMPLPLNERDEENDNTRKVGIWGWVVKGGYTLPFLKVIMEYGYAAGDEYVADREFTGRPLHPDYNVGLLLYEEVLAWKTKEVWTDAAKGFWSNGGVYNSHYIFPRLKLMARPFEAIFGFLTAWVDRVDGAVIEYLSDDEMVEFQSTGRVEEKRSLGYEFDMALKARLKDRLNWTIEGGILFPSERLGLEDEIDNIWTIQSRVAVIF